MEGENKGGKESLENFCFALMLDVDHVDAEEEEVESWHCDKRETDSLTDLPCCWMWNMRSPPFRYSITKKR